MNFKKYFILILMLFVILSISSVSANDNQTIIEECAMDENADLTTVDEQDNLQDTTQIQTRVSINDVTVNEGKSITFAGNVYSYSSGKTPTGKLSFVNSAHKTIGSADLSSGYAKFTFDNNYSPGKYQFTARYGGGSATYNGVEYKFQSSSATFNLIVNGEATLSGENYNSYYLSGENLYLKLTDNYNGKTLANKNVNVYFYTTSKNYNTLSLTTDSNGMCEVKINKIPGNYWIIASIKDSYIKSNSLRLDVSVSETPLILETNNIVGTAKSDISLKAVGRYPSGDVVNSGHMYFTVGGKTYEVNVVNGIATQKIKLNAGHYTCTVKFDSANSYYSEPTTTFNIVINQANSGSLKLNKWISTTKSYATLKATVKDSKGNNINEGTVSFLINGKSYTVNVKNGVATKKVKLTSAKTYSYKAIFTSKNYNSKTATSKVYVKKAKKYYKLKFGKYTAKITHKQYLKLLNAKNNGKYYWVTVKTGKYQKVKEPIYKKVKVKNPHWIYKKVLFYKSVSSSDWSDTTYYDYPLDKYYKSGWQLYGWKDVETNGGHVFKTYAKLKKKVKYSTKEVKTGKYKTTKVPYKITLETWGGISSKDEMSLSTDTYFKTKKVNLLTLKL